MRRKIQKATHRPRLYIFRSNKHIYAQVIDDNTSRTITASSSLCPKIKDSIVSSSTCETAKLIGQDIASKLKIKGIQEIVVDRGKKIYHGRIKALAEAARSAGIKF